MKLTKYDLFLIILICFIVTILFSPLLKKAVYVDDALIYLRVVDNIINGHGWAYNISDSTDPCTSTFYTIFLLILAWMNNAILSNIKSLHLNMDQVPAIANIICVNLIAIIQYFAYRKDRYKAFAISISSAICGIFIKAAGMESHLFVMLILSAALAYQYECKIVVGLLAGLIALTRPEGLAFISIPVTISLIFFRRFDFRSIASFILTILPWYTFSWLHFGSIFPNPVYMKNFMSSLFMLSGETYLKGFVNQPLFPYLTFLLFLIGCLKVLQNAKHLQFYPLIVLIYGIIHTAGYTIMHACSVFFWYYAIGNFVVNFIIIIAIYWIIESLYYLLLTKITKLQKLKQRITSKSTFPMLTKALFSILIIISMLKIGISPLEQAKPYRNAEDYINISKWILKNTKKEDRVLSGEIGYIGFYSKREMRDPFCLIHRDYGRKYLVTNKDLLWWYRNDPPEVIIAKYNIHTKKAYPFADNNSYRKLLDNFLETYKTAYISGKYHVWQRMEQF